MNVLKPTTKTVSSLCLRCAREKRTCCSADPEEASLFFPLSDAEWRRLLPYASRAVFSEPFEGPGHPGEDRIRAHESNCPEFSRSIRRLFPDLEQVARLFPEKGGHFRLRIRANGDCIFLGAHGCLLPRRVRPWYCLLFPTWVSNGVVTYFMAEQCLLASSASSVMDVCTSLNTDAETVRALFKALCADWGIIFPEKV